MCNLYACNAVQQEPGSQKMQYVVIEHLKGSLNPQGDVSLVTVFLSILLN